MRCPERTGDTGRCGPLRKKNTNRRVAPPLGAFKLVFVCDQTGTTGFWQHPINGARTRCGGALTQRFSIQDKDKIRAALASADNLGRDSFVAALEGGTHAGTLVEIHLERMKMGSRHLLLGFTPASHPIPAPGKGLAESERVPESTSSPDMARAVEGPGLAAQALEYLAEGVLILDPELRVISVNRAYTNISGYPQEKMVGKAPYSLLDEVMPPALRKEILRTVASNGHWRGELRDRRANGDIFPELASLSAVRDRQGQISQYVAVVTDMTQLHKYEDRMAFLASHDSLSGLPNRFVLMRSLAEAVEQAVNSAAPMALMYLDIDNFALINSSFGTAVGDRVLRKLAHRLQETVAGVGEAYHLGSDGFGVLLTGIVSKHDVLELGKNILAALEAPLQAGGQNLYLSASIGIALAPPDQDAQMVFRHAGHAMHAAMRQGAGSIEFFEGAESDAGEAVRLATGLRHAMSHGELFLHYQPYFDLYSGRISGAEALVRWQHPELGLIPPARFIPVAEETGHIVRLGEWVLKSACLQMRAWQDAGLQDMHMAVNLSARQLRQPDFLDRLVGILDETGLLPGNLVLELTESSMMENPERTRAVFNELHALGVRIAIDDFGTGYSSLNYLSQYQVDYLKVDRTFVSNLPHDEHQQAIMRAIIAMAKSLDIQVIAEGVETSAQWEFLKTLDCEQGQGFLFAHPQPAANVEELMRNGAMFFRPEP
jgi:diguanylate cyclase (GGDEF)-like protein/PAS domain S-box-containing protein